MNIVISNKSKVGLGQIKVSGKNPIAKVNFSKIAKIGSLPLAGLSDVTAVNPQDGQTLVYDSGTNTYIIETLPKIDGGLF